MTHTDEAAQWLKRAEEARTIADRMRNPEAKGMMLKIARDYETLAKQALLTTGIVWLPGKDDAPE